MHLQGYMRESNNRQTAYNKKYKIIAFIGLLNTLKMTFVSLRMANNSEEPTLDVITMRSGGWFNINIPFHHYRKSSFGGHIQWL